MDSCTWKSNWAETRQHLTDWWNHTGLVLGGWCAPEAPVPNNPDPIPPPPPGDIRLQYEDVEWRARMSHAQVGKGFYGADILPIAWTEIGPGSLATALGSEPRFSTETIWFDPVFQDAADVNALPPLCFNPDAHWWRIHEAQLRRQKKLGAGRYLVGLPLLLENMDILASLRGAQMLMMDLIENPEWVIRSIREINEAWFQGYGRLYDICKEPDGSSAVCSFSLWGPGKTGLVSCDASAMISPEMFRDFVKPALTEQCAGLDYSMYHLDGLECICHLDHLLDIEPLRANEWTPPPAAERGVHERWNPLYKRILDAGKSVLILGEGVDEIEPVLNAIGSKGVYIIGNLATVEEVEAAARIADRRRRS